jgi:hypothetical protein
MDDMTTGQKPDFLIIGAQRCGTTSLFFYLLQHPELFLPVEKEIHFFDLHYGNGPCWYRNIFKSGTADAKKLKGEASPYYLFHHLVAERVARHFPGMKLIVLLRDPVERAYSHFLHSRRIGVEHLESFEEAVAREPERVDDEKRRIMSGETENSESYRNFSYLYRGLYYQQISHWMNFFPPSQIHCIKSEELFDNPGPVYSKVCGFLEISDHKDVIFSPINVFSYPHLSPELKHRIRPFFLDDMSCLAHLLGDNFFWE